MSVANYEFVAPLPLGVPPGSVVLRDIGPHDQFKTITNAADEVVSELWRAGKLKNGQRLFYFDSMGDLDELVIEGGRFVDFKVGPR